MTQKQTTGVAGDTTVPGRPAGVTHGDAAYWARVRRIVADAPPLSDQQRATIRAALSQPAKPEGEGSMSDHTVGQWPVDQPVRLASVPAPAADPAPIAPPVVVPVPEVLLVVTVDLTGRYDRSSDVTADLYEQTRHSTDCHTAIVRLGEEALRCGSGLGQAIAARFFLAARRIEVHVPAGTRWAFVASDVRQHLRHMTADHARMLNSTRAPGG